jgi:hypothetical protein
VGLLLATLLAFAPEASAQVEVQVSFARDVRPILARRCYACHGPDDAESGLALHEQAASRAPLDSGAVAVVPGDAAASEMLARISATDPSMRMPPEGKPLSPGEVDTLRRWIEQGGEYETHWAFAPMSRPPVPPVEQAGWVRNPIDAFVLARLEAAGLSPNPAADRRTLCRRLYYDLVGLPPTTAELDEFMADTAPDSYERLVDKLLASPQYGEKWARHWLDVVRYAESNSFERDNPKPNVWKYRDYVIRSFNDDKPYDQFVREQLAGDELDAQHGGVTAETMTATGYFRLGVWDDEPADPVQSLADEMDDLVSTTGQAFLGLTVGCARCHDHKIDPIPQTDYFALVAFFADVTSYGSRGDQVSNNQYVAEDAETTRRRSELARSERRLVREKFRIERDAIVRMPGVLQRETEGRNRERVLEEHLAKYLEPAEAERYAKLEAELGDVRQQLRELPPEDSVLALAKRKVPVEPVYVHLRGNPHVLGDTEIAPRVPELFGDVALAIPAVAPGASSAGRRRVLADWIVDDNNPLAARVMANRVWQHHFGRGIVRSANNFGQLGTPPTHPELLNWLGHYLVDHQWRLKPLHRLMVTSSTYRMSSAGHHEALARDPLNDLYWRFDPRRLTAEEIRDSVLAVSGNLSSQVYGPSMYPRLSAEVLATQSQPGANWHRSSDQDRWRRSIYIHIKRSLAVPLLAAFDAPEPDISCEARFNTTQPAQAFALLHGDFMHEQAHLLAARVRQMAGDDLRQQIATAVELVLLRDATDHDLADGLDLIEKLKSRHHCSADEALRLYCLAVMNFNEFVYLD